MGAQDAIDDIERHVLNGSIFPEFQNIPAEKLTVVFGRVEPLSSMQLFNGYQVLPIPVKHIPGSVGYQFLDTHSGSGFLYTADSGPNLSKCWENLSVNTIITEVILPNRRAEFALKTNHLTPEFLGIELNNLKKIRPNLPEIFIVHMDNQLEDEIVTELKVISDDLDVKITPASEGIEFLI